jgi:hypothetical protein
MDIDDSAREGFEERRFDHAHVAGEDHVIDPGLAQGLDEALLGFGRELRAKRAGVKELGAVAAMSRELEDAGSFHIGKDDGDLHAGERAGGNGIGDGVEIGAFAGAEDAETKWWVGEHVGKGFRVSGSMFQVPSFARCGDQLETWNSKPGTICARRVPGRTRRRTLILPEARGGADIPAPRA